MEVDEDKLKTGQANIKVVGIGGGGGNAANWLYLKGIQGAEVIQANTDKQHLDMVEGDRKILMGEDLTRGLGAGGHPPKGRDAAQESISEIKDSLKGSDMVFITAGMGGGTGTGGAPVVAEAAKEMDAIVIGCVTMPFKIERARVDKAEHGLQMLRDHCDTVVVIDNERLVKIAGDLPVRQAFAVANELISTMIKGIVETISTPSLVNLDFADVKSIMERAGGALVSMGYGEGADRVIEAAQVALKSPLLDIESIEGTDGLLVNITGGEDLTLAEVDRAMKLISKAAVPGAKILFGAVVDPQMEGRVQITLIATGLGVEKTVTAPAKQEGVSLAEIFGDDLAVPAFMRSPAYAQAGWRN